MVDFDYPAGRFTAFLNARGVEVRRIIAFAGLSTLALVDSADAPGEPAVAKGLSGYYHVIHDAPPERQPGTYGYYWYKRYGPEQYAAWHTAFRFEYETLRALRGSPGIVEVSTGDMDAAIPYYLMRHHPAGSLAHHAGSLGWDLDADFVLTVARDVAGGLETLHRRGVAHRDLNAENVLLTEEGHAVVADLGCARDVRSGPLGPARRPDEFHWPPEYATAYDTADAKADLYALGVLIHQMTTGRMPRYLGPSCVAAAPAGRFPAELLKIADACLEHRPENRPEAADVLARLHP
ncbi:hypothetical protein GCM10022243_58030 [Saccharothrix violaceirubra]|uniref:Serine/threonine-protein kinase n=1 Tax=Saccharothrix violaceirubra TaxID=413306 RepID=A0A7W7T3C7_9PSEU|nr:protein kinase [Saccharothrix violaceirubra]MBB4965766.1 serine/threonine-protein kinase [Saccharothrix violaceirubra]